jgi:transcriptional regulator with XRE-family HTH domain
MESIVSVLRRLRGDRGLTQRDVAALLGTTQSAVARLEGGGSSPRLRTLEAYAAAVGGVLTVERPDLVGNCVASIRRGLAHGDVDAALRATVQLVDDAGRADQPEELLRREPMSTGDRRWDAAVAAAVAWVARRHGCEPPGWTAAPSRFLDGPWWPVEDVLGRPLSAGLAAYLLANAPAEFFGRGVIIDADTLASV